MPNYRQPWSFPSEVATLDFLVRRLHTSLERLVLPAESAPIQTISSLQWPRLREFTLRGERWSDPETPIVSLFSLMSSLRSLALQLSEPQNAAAGVVWPREFSATFPWPYLESLRISQPGPADKIYSHLPPSLRALSLRSWPHEGIRIYDERRAILMPSWHQGYKSRWQTYPLSTPRNLAEVLRKCELSLLPSLELEYRVDAQESQEPELLRLLSTRFQHLTTLEVHRFRSKGSYEVVVTEFAEALAPLASLRMLKLHLDFPFMPRVKLGIEGRLPDRTGSDPFGDKLQRAAEELSRTLAPSLEEIWMFKYDYHPMWAVFVVTRGVGPDGERHAEVALQKHERPYVY